MVCKVVPGRAAPDDVKMPNAQQPHEGRYYALRKRSRQEPKWNSHLSQVLKVHPIILPLSKLLGFIQDYPGYPVGQLELPYVGQEKMVGDVVDRDQEDGGVPRVRIKRRPYLGCEQMLLAFVVEVQESRITGDQDRGRVRLR